LKALPLSETTVRLPSVFIALFNVGLVYGIALRLFRRESWAAVAALLMTFTPAHFIHARLAMDYLYPVPFLLAWFLLFIEFLERDRLWLLFGGCTCLGLGFYTYIAATAMMPIYLATTCAVLWLRGERPWQAMMIAVAGFAWPVLLSIPFHLQYPDVLGSKWTTYGTRGFTSTLDPFQQLRELSSYPNVTARTSLYFNFFNPSYLFLSGGPNVVNSTRTSGVFLLPLAIFIPVGIYEVLRRRGDASHVLLILGFATAPLAALAIMESGAIDRELELLPFGVLLATCGIQRLWDAPLRTNIRRACSATAAAGLALGLLYGLWTLTRHGRISGSTLPLVVTSSIVYIVGRVAESRRQWRPIVVALVAFAGWEFYGFYRDYLTDYPMRTLAHFEGNRRAAIEEAISRIKPDQPTRVFISQNIQHAEAAWQFYVAKLQREDLKPMTYFAPEALDDDAIPSGALILTTSTAGADMDLVNRSSWVLLKRITELDGTVSFLLFEKDGPPSGVPRR